MDVVKYDVHFDDAIPDPHSNHFSLLIAATAVITLIVEMCIGLG